MLWLIVAALCGLVVLCAWCSTKTRSPEWHDAFFALACLACLGLWTLALIQLGKALA